jgi:hypothetical protein
VAQEPEAQVCGWTLYMRPPDYPDHFVVLQWWVTAEGGLRTRSTAVVCNTLEEARAQVPPGTICMPRDEDDDPTVIETWI